MTEHCHGFRVAHKICCSLCERCQNRYAANTDVVCLVLQKKTEAGEYHKLIVSRLKEQRERRSESLAKKRAIRMASQASAQEATTGKQPTS